MKSYFFNLGYNSFGPLVLNYCIWLKNNCKKNGIKKIYFFSRDGIIFKKAFEKMYKNEFDTYYFYASRRSLVVPALATIDNVKDIFQFNIFGEKICIRDFLKKVGIDENIYTDLVLKYKIDIKKEWPIDELILNDNIISFLNEVFPFIKRNAIKEKKSFLLYKKKKNFNGKIAIVDVGWYGSMQSALKKIDEETEIFGFYVGLIPTSESYDKKYSFGYLFDKTHDKILFDEFRNCQNLLEFMTLAQHGSVKRYTMKEKEEVEFIKYEYEGTKEKEYIKQIHNGALNYVDNNYLILKEENNRKAISNLIKLCNFPTIKDAKSIGNLKLIDKEPLYFAKIELNLFKGLKKSLWKVGYLKRIFKLKLPYYKLINILRKRKEKRHE